MKNVYIEEPIRKILLKQVKEEDLLALESGDESRISQIQDKLAPVRYEMAVKMMEGIMLSVDPEFNRLVEEKAASYRNGEGKKYMLETYGKNREVF